MIPWGFLFLLGCAWIGWKFYRTTQELETLAFCLRRLEQELARTRAQLELLSRNEPTTAPSPGEPGLSALLRARKTAVGETAPLAVDQATSTLVPPLLPQAVPTSSSIFTAETVDVPPLLSVSDPIVPSELKEEPRVKEIRFNWERFLGVKLFAWLGGLALVLGVAFSIKYSFENNLISPQGRIGLGYLIGIGLVVGAFFIPRARHLVTVQTFCATGTLILYVDTFAAHAYYKLLPSTPTFVLMSLITFTAFLLAVRLDAQVVAVLGLLGGFLTPPLLSTGVDNPGGLFGFLALLNTGLIATSLRKRWTHLVLLAAIASMLMEAGWVAKFFSSEKTGVAMTVFIGFGLLFLIGWFLARRMGTDDCYVSASAILMPCAAFSLALFILAHPYPEIARRPLVYFGFVLLADLLLLTLSWKAAELRIVSFLGGLGAFAILAFWSADFLRIDLLNHALAAFLFFGILHSAFPIVLQRLKPGEFSASWANLFPVCALGLLLVPLLKLAVVSWAIWIAIMIVDAMALMLAFYTLSLLGVIAVILLTLGGASFWIMHLPVAGLDIVPMLIVIGAFALMFLGSSIMIVRKLLPKINFANGGPDSNAVDMTGLAQLAALGAALPFLLLGLVVSRLSLFNPSAVFGLALLLAVLFLGVSLLYGADMLAITTFVSLLLLEHFWHFKSFRPEMLWLAAGWNIVFSLVFLIAPFLLQKRIEGRLVPWALSALALPLHFLLLYHGFGERFPLFQIKGIIPAILSIPLLIGLMKILRRPVVPEALQNTVLALFAGAALFFITFIFPTQFNRQWLTVGWALEGLALLWLFQRISHPGLRMVGCILLATSFARLALNPWVINKYDRSGSHILNWYLYIYGTVSLALLVGGRLLTPPRDQIGQVKMRPVLGVMGTILAFLLLNIEIADFFSGAGERLTFNFSASLAQDMTYSLAWGVFAFILLIIGFKSLNSPIRYSGMALLVFTLLKLFLHDLWRLGGLYRIGSLVGMALVLMVVSFIYQRFLSTDALSKQSITESESK
ncbi:MAG: hypothetical protein JWM99_4052 [Verrucomicrobiales bacterium]|nr:hypothetical protein [Verrucomicrobiales bacterium]